MPEQALQYQLAELKPEDFMVVPSLNVVIAKAKARASDGKVLTRIGWYDTNLLTQSLNPSSDSITYLYPSIGEWSKARKYLQQNYPELEKDFISGECEWVDSLLAFPNSERGYSPILQIPGIKEGKVPLLINHAKVEKSGESYILKEGKLTKVTEVPELPLKSGYIQAWSEDLGLPTKVGNNPNEKFEGAYFWVDTDYIYHEGLRALIRGPWYWGVRARRFDTAANWDPSDSFSAVGFRLGRVASADEGFVKIPRTDYEAMIKEREAISKSMKRLDELLSKVKV